MSQSAKIHSIDALDGLAAGLGQYAVHAQQVMESAATEAKRTIEWLEQRQRFWHNEVLRRKEMVRRAAAIFNDCRSPVYDSRTGRSYIPSCNEELQQLRKTERYLSEAEAEEQKVIRAKHAVQNAFDQYQKEARQLHGIFQNQVPTAANWLRRKATILRDYAASQPHLSVGDVFAGAVILGIGLAVMSQQATLKADNEPVDAGDDRQKKPYTDVEIKTEAGEDKFLRVYPNGKSDMLRVFDTQAKLSEWPTTTATYANITHEHEHFRDQPRTRLNDIVVRESDRGQGIGTALLAECERQAKLRGSVEIYGTFVPGVSEAERQSADFRQKVKNWYKKQGYEFRAFEGRDDGEVFKVIR